jgi:glycosyltransferase involved in cell wall biosynthesis
MRITLLTNHLAPYRLPLYRLLAQRHELQVLLFGGGERYVAPWFAPIEQQIRGAGFPAAAIHTHRQAFEAARGSDVVIAPFAGGAMLAFGYLGARAHGTRFILWASVWSQPRSAAHALALPLTRRIYRDADAVIAYGEHVRRFAAHLRGRADDVFIAPQAVEAELFARAVSAEEVRAFRDRYALGPGQLALFCGRLVPEKVGVLLEAWRGQPATLVLAGDGPLRRKAQAHANVRAIGTLARSELPVAYAAATCTVLPTVPTARFREPWGLVCNESLHQGTPVVVSDAVGAAAGGLVRDEQTGLVVAHGDPHALAAAISRLLDDALLCRRLGRAGQAELAAYSYAAMVAGFEQAIASATGTPAPGSSR